MSMSCLRIRSSRRSSGPSYTWPQTQKKAIARRFRPAISAARPAWPLPYPRRFSRPFHRQWLCGQHHGRSGIRNRRRRGRNFRLSINHGLSRFNRFRFVSIPASTSDDPHPPARCRCSSLLQLLRSLQSAQGPAQDQVQAPRLLPQPDLWPVRLLPLPELSAGTTASWSAAATSGMALDSLSTSASGASTASGSASLAISTTATGSAASQTADKLEGAGEIGGKRPRG